MGWSAPESLLEGPRGRRLCWSLIEPGGYSGWDRVWDAAQAGDLTGFTDELTACAAGTDLGAVVLGADESTLVAALAQPVEMAMYWQEPDEEDRALAADAVRQALLPVAEALVAAPATRWWPGPLATGRQQYVEWPGGPDMAPATPGAIAELQAWRAETLSDEQSAQERPDNPAAPWSGYWWSTPRPSRLPSTTRSVPGLGAVGLVLVEDGLGWAQARCWPAESRPDVRVYEISGPAQWAELVGRYPMDVSNSRRHDWWRATGWAGRWLIPDFTAVAADYDAVHLSVAGYLTTAGRDLPVGDARTVLAGWDPDATYWLTDTLRLWPPATDWVRSDEDPLGWTDCTGEAQPA
jgi:hypothetical protein